MARISNGGGLVDKLIVTPVQYYIGIVFVIALIAGGTTAALVAVTLGGAAGGAVGTVPAGAQAFANGFQNTTAAANKLGNEGKSLLGELGVEPTVKEPKPKN